MKLSPRAYSGQRYFGVAVLQLSPGVGTSHTVVAHSLTVYEADKQALAAEGQSSYVANNLILANKPVSGWVNSLVAALLLLVGFSRCYSERY